MFDDEKYIADALARLDDKKAIENDIAKITKGISKTESIYIPVGYNIKNHRFEKMTDDYDPYGVDIPDIPNYVLGTRVMNLWMCYETFKDAFDNTIDAILNKQNPPLSGHKEFHGSIIGGEELFGDQDPDVVTGAFTHGASEDSDIEIDYNRLDKLLKVVYNKWSDDLKAYKREHQTMSIDDIKKIGYILIAADYFLTLFKNNGDPQDLCAVCDDLGEVITEDLHDDYGKGIFTYLKSGNLADINPKNFIEAIKDSGIIEEKLTSGYDIINHYEI